MALAQDGSILVQVLSTLSNPLDLSTPRDELRKSYRFPFANGVGADQADEAWHDTRTVAFGATDSLDLSGGVTNAFGQSMTLTKVKAIVLRADAANPNDLEITRPAANGLLFMKAVSDAMLLKPGGCLVLIAPAAAGIAVTAGTGDLLDVVNPGGSGNCIYDVILLGIE